MSSFRLRSSRRFPGPLRRWLPLAVAGLVFTAAGTFPTGTATACPFCSAPTLTLSEQFAKSDAAVLVQWSSAKPGKDDDLGNTTYEVLRVLRDPLKTLEKGQKLTLERHRPGRAGDLSLLLGTKGDKLEWGAPLEVSETSFNYVLQAPAPESEPVARLAYFLKFLEFPDQTVANDAYAEFANAPYKDIVPLAPQMPKEKLRKWIASPDTLPARLGLYGLMLGLCGEPADAQLMQQKILEKSADFRLGIDGVIGGYLLLTGEKGLELIEEAKLKDKTVVFSETYAALQALRFLWTYGNGRVPAERLRNSMRILLDRPEMADIIIGDLARWKDWTVQPRLMQMYGDQEFNIPSVKRAIVRYLIASTKDLPPATNPGEKPTLPPHAVAGKKYLDELRAKDPKLVSEVERFAF